MQSVALIGLGAMGSGMAGQLLKKGFPLVVYNRHAERAARIVGQGARLASSPREAAEDADIVIGMVADDPASRSVWLGERGVLSGARPGTIAVESSTVSVNWVQELAAVARAHGCEFLDAPVTGSRTHAASGELLFLVGGDGGTLERARPVLQAMSRDIAHLGPTGSGALMKLINNFICGVQAASLGEGLAIIERSGLDREKALAILANGAPGSPLVKALSARMAARSYDVNFALRLMLKDLTYAAAEAHNHGVALRTAAAALELFQQAAGKGLADRDFSAVAEASRQ